MAYDASLAQQIRNRLGEHGGVTEREMFGGIAFMINGNVAVGVIGDELMVRVGKDAHDESVAETGARPFDIGPRPARGWLSVGASGIATHQQLDKWVDRGATFAASLPPK